MEVSVFSGRHGVGGFGLSELFLLLVGVDVGGGVGSLSGLGGRSCSSYLHLPHFQLGPRSSERAEPQDP